MDFLFERMSRMTLYFVFQDVKEYTWCLKIPPKCVTYRTKLVTRWKTENATRVVNVRSCCPGYQNNRKGYCKPICKESCGTHGHCAQPDVCSCEPGFSGDKCQDVGCPGMIFLIFVLRRSIALNQMDRKSRVSKNTAISKKMITQV